MAPHSVTVDKNKQMLTVKSSLIHGYKQQHHADYTAKVVPVDMGAEEAEEAEEVEGAEGATGKRDKRQSKKEKKKGKKNATVAAAGALHASFSVHVLKLSVRSPGEEEGDTQRGDTQRGDTQQYTVGRNDVKTGGMMEVDLEGLPSRTYEAGEQKVGGIISTSAYTHLKYSV
jgi:hypothetical protein